LGSKEAFALSLQIKLTPNKIFTHTHKYIATRFVKPEDQLADIFTKAYAGQTRLEFMFSKAGLI
jgi:hypothetical protein